MQLIISGRGVVLTPSFKAEIARKLDRLRRLLPGALQARVRCAAEKFRRSVQLTVRARDGVFASTATAADLLLAMDDAVAALDRQVRERKDRRRLGRRRAVRPRVA